MNTQQSLHDNTIDNITAIRKGLLDFQMISEIAESLQLSARQVQCMITKFKIDVTELKKSKIEHFLMKGHSMADIAKYLNISTYRLRRFITINNIKTKV